MDCAPGMEKLGAYSDSPILYIIIKMHPEVNWLSLRFADGCGRLYQHMSK